MYRIVPVDPRDAQVLEPLGTKRKFWFTAKDGRRLLFKAEERGTGEDWAEKVACELAGLLGIPHVEYDLAHDTQADVPGVVCPSIIRRELGLAHGNQLLLALDKHYPQHRRFRVSEHTVEAVAKIIGILDPVPETWFASASETAQSAMATFIGYTMLDAFTANQDRHHENWAAIFDLNQLCLAPTFDHGAAMARNIPDVERQERLSTKDHQRQVPAFARRALSALYETGASKPLTTLAAYRAFAQFEPSAALAWEDKLRSVTETDILEILNQVPPERMSTVCRDFTLYLLMENRFRILNGELV